MTYRSWTEGKQKAKYHDYLNSSSLLFLTCGFAASIHWPTLKPLYRIPFFVCFVGNRWHFMDIKWKFFFLLGK